jgi:hypothetical protein
MVATMDGVGTDEAEDSDALADLFLAATMSIYFLILAHPLTNPSSPCFMINS